MRTLQIEKIVVKIDPEKIPQGPVSSKIDQHWNGHDNKTCDKSGPGPYKFTVPFRSEKSNDHIDDEPDIKAAK